MFSMKLSEAAGQRYQWGPWPTHPNIIGPLRVNKNTRRQHLSLEFKINKGLRLIIFGFLIIFLTFLNTFVYFDLVFSEYNLIFAYFQWNINIILGISHWNEDSNSEIANWRNCGKQKNWTGWKKNTFIYKCTDHKL